MHSLIVCYEKCIMSISLYNCLWGRQKQSRRTSNVPDHWIKETSGRIILLVLLFMSWRTNWHTHLTEVWLPYIRIWYDLYQLLVPSDGRYGTSFFIWHVVTNYQIFLRKKYNWAIMCVCLRAVPFFDRNTEYLYWIGKFNIHFTHNR